MRHLHLVGFGFALWLALGASASHAIDVTWELENLTSFDTGTTIVAENGDLVRVRIAMDSSVEGASGYSFSLLWDEVLDDELELVSFTNTPPPPLIELAAPAAQESSHVVPGQLSSFNGASLLMGAFFGERQVGEAVFRVEKVSPDGVDLRLALLPIDGDGFYDAAMQPVVVALPDATIDGQADCDDAADNDGDGLQDFVGGDPGCTGFLDGSEKDPGLPCDDGEDNDEDGLTDFPADPQCSGPQDPSEAFRLSPVPSVGGLSLFALAGAIACAGYATATRRRRLDRAS